jgi:hypothetical protein
MKIGWIRILKTAQKTVCGEGCACPAAGAVFGWLRWKTRPLVVPVSVHALVNGVILLLQ